MSPDLMNYLPLILLGLIALVIAAWVIARLSRKARVIEDESGAPLVRDVLAEGAAPAPRNQALIDAAPAAVMPEPATGPVPVAAAEPAHVAVPATATATGDDLTRIKGLGPKLAALLGEIGITTFAQIAAWEPADIEQIDARLGRFSGRITRDQWVEQAKLLCAGDESSFVAKFGQNG